MKVGKYQDHKNSAILLGNQRIQLLASNEKSK